VKGNDLDTYAEQSVIVVLEGVLADLTYAGRVRKRLKPAAEWQWQQLALRRMVQWQRNNIVVDIVTFVSEFAAESAGEFLVDYGYEFGAIGFRQFDLFCDALIVQRPTGVYDSEPSRLNRYGQFGVGAVKGQDFA
jgi:hypothetical protein